MMSPTTAAAEARAVDNPESIHTHEGSVTRSLTGFIDTCPQSTGPTTTSTL